MEKRPCRVRVIMTNAVSFLNAVKKSQTYCMLTFSQQLDAIWTFAVLKSRFWVAGELQCVTLHPTVAQTFEALNNYLWTLNVKESVCLVGPKDVNIQLEDAACYCICWTSSPILIGGKHVPKASSDQWQDMGALFTSRVKVVQHEVASQGISITQKIEDTAVHWQDHGKCVLGFRRSDSCWFSGT
jgi:uncharacterized protein YfaA (DUF2138 family)